VDYYQRNGNVLSGEGSFGNVQNEVFVTGIGRVQVLGANKAYGRLWYSGPRFFLQGWWNHRDAADSSSDRAQRSLATGAFLLEHSNIYHVEGQYNHGFDGDRGRVVAGASYRSINVNTFGTLMALEDDDRHDHIASAYAQAEYKLHPQIKLVGAVRFDDGNLFDAQVSPKAAIVYSPNERHSFRLSVNRAFMTPNYSEWFLRVNAGAPVNFSALEAGLRANPSLGPLLAGVPQGQLFGPNDIVPVLALGNAKLEPETTLGWELGYKGNITNRFYVGVDLYTAQMKNFVTDLLPGVNPAYGGWQAPEEVPEQGQAALEAAVRTVLLSNPATALAGKGLSTLPDGQTAIVVSYTNAGWVQQYGMELAAGYQFSDAFRLDASLVPFGYDVKSAQLGDQLIANTPGLKATFALSYISLFGLDASAQVRLIDGYEWAAGVYAGYVPAQELVNLSVGYSINNALRVSATATDLFDQQRFSIFGGAVVGRRAIGQVQVSF
jgi:iron complex outermembrane receptor protein